MDVGANGAYISQMRSHAEKACENFKYHVTSNVGLYIMKLISTSIYFHDLT